MTSEPSNAPESPWGLIVVGAIIAAFGGAIILYADSIGWLGYFLAWTGGILTAIGVIGAGVTAGILRAEWMRERQRS